MKVLLTGVAGFIGMHTAIRLSRDGHEVLGIDNLNDYYNPKLKLDRQKQLKSEKNVTLLNFGIEDREKLFQTFSNFKPEAVVHLAAQAGVRFSIQAPERYISSNIVGFQNIIDASKQAEVKHFLYASSSSVYGNQTKAPFSETDAVDHPISLYAATKRSNELVAHAYSHLFDLPTTGLRFFTVYGPWGRPDMAPHLFASAILNETPIRVFNNGNLSRDFTYIDDITLGIAKVLTSPPPRDSVPMSMDPSSAPSGAPFRLLNIGNHTPVMLMDFILCLETALEKKAILEFAPMQPGDVLTTHADTSHLHSLTGYEPTTTLSEGINRFAQWHKPYYQLG